MICWQESLWTAELEYSVNLWPTNAIYVCVCVYIYIYIFFLSLSPIVDQTCLKADNCLCPLEADRC